MWDANEVEHGTWAQDPIILTVSIVVLEEKLLPFEMKFEDFVEQVHEVLLAEQGASGEDGDG